jgi:hypothetical protein
MRLTFSSRGWLGLGIAVALLLFGWCLVMRLGYSLFTLGVYFAYLEGPVLIVVWTWFVFGYRIAFVPLAVGLYFLILYTLGSMNALIGSLFQEPVGIALFSIVLGFGLSEFGTRQLLSRRAWEHYKGGVRLVILIAGLANFLWVMFPPWVK